MLPARVAQRFFLISSEGTLSPSSNSFWMKSLLAKVECSDRLSGAVLDPMLWSTGLKRQHLQVRKMVTLLDTNHQTRLDQQLRKPLNGIQRNMSRLRTRRLLEIALASMATQTFRTTMEKIVDRPADWKNWERKDWADELMESMGTTKLQRLLVALNRVTQLSMLAAPILIMAPFAYVSDSVHRYSWKYALWSIEQAGPTFIKWVQWATSRQDLFTPEFCQYFGKLRDDITPHDWKYTDSILKEDLGNLTDNLQIDTTPIGSGCVAQVYRGKLTQAVGQFPAGTALAIKVQHPRVWEKVCVDFYIMGKVALFLESLPYFQLKYLALVDTVRQFRDVMLPQLDLTLEARHLQRFNRDFANDDRVNFPRPLNGLSSKRVLTETFSPGTPILSYVTKSEQIRKDLAYLGVETTLKMIFLNDFLHGDLHPGNILVHEPRPGKVTLNLLDCGLVVEMGPEQHVNLTKILGALAKRQGKLAGQLMVDTSSDCQATDEDLMLFVEGIGRISNENTNFIEHVGETITDICYLACRHKVKLEPAFISASLAVELVEGIAKALYHDIPVSSTALRFIFQAELMHGLPALKLW